MMLSSQAARINRNPKPTSASPGTPRPASRFPPLISRSLRVRSKVWRRAAKNRTKLNKTCPGMIAQRRPIRRSRFPGRIGCWSVFSR